MRPSPFSVPHRTQASARVSRTGSGAGPPGRGGRGSPTWVPGVQARGLESEGQDQGTPVAGESGVRGREEGVRGGAPREGPEPQETSEEDAKGPRAWRAASRGTAATQAPRPPRTTPPGTRRPGSHWAAREVQRGGSPTLSGPRPPRSLPGPPSQPPQRRWGNRLGESCPESDLSARPGVAQPGRLRALAPENAALPRGGGRRAGRAGGRGRGALGGAGGFGAPSAAGRLCSSPGRAGPCGAPRPPSLSASGGRRPPRLRPASSAHPGVTPPGLRVALYLLSGHRSGAALRVAPHGPPRWPPFPGPRPPDGLGLPGNTGPRRAPQRLPDSASSTRNFLTSWPGPGHLFFYFSPKTDLFLKVSLHSLLV